MNYQYLSHYHQHPSGSINLDTNTDEWKNVLDNERKNNSKESWNKLDKGIKIAKLCNYAEKYGVDNKITESNVQYLKTFFINCIENGKLQKTKDVMYDKNIGVIQNVPALYFNTNLRRYTLRNLDSKHVTTIKSLTPKKITNNKNKVISQTQPRLKIITEAVVNDISTNTIVTTTPLSVDI